MSNNLLKKVDLDFMVVEDYDPRYIVVIDNSEWGGVENKPAIIEITIPSFKNPVTHYFTKKGTHIFNSLNLGLNCKNCVDMNDIPDGIYHITIKGSPDKYNKTKSYLRTSKLERDIDNVLMKNMGLCGEDKCILSEYNKISLLIRTAKAHLRNGNNCGAFSFYKEAKDVSERLIKCVGSSNKQCNCK